MDLLKDVVISDAHLVAFDDLVVPDTDVGVVVESLGEMWTRTFWNSPPSRDVGVHVVQGSCYRSIFFLMR
jgi:hypothetical protein